MLSRCDFRLFCVTIATVCTFAAAQAQSNYAAPYKFVTLAGDVGFYSTDGTGTAGHFNGPLGVAVDAFGSVYVADTSNHTIRKITNFGVVTTFAGAAGIKGTADGPGGVARFSSPSGVALDAAGNVYVADTQNHRIRKITSGGVVTTLAGDNAGAADGIGSVARFRFPNGVAVDGAGNVYVADTENRTIRKITNSGVVTTLAGSASTGSGSADGTGSVARFNHPTGVAVDTVGNVYVADSYNSTIRKITSGGVVTTLAGSANIFDNLGSSDGTGSAARFWNAQGVAVDSTGNVYVADTGNASIRKIASGGAVTTLANVAEADGSTERFTGPTGVAVDSAGNFYIVGTSSNRVRKVTSGGVVITLAGVAGGSAGSTDGIGSAARFAGPGGIAADSAGNIYVADTGNSTIRKITSAGVTTTLAGASGIKNSADGTGSAARFNFPAGVAVDGGGNIYVADTGNSTIRKVTSGGVVTTLAGKAGVPGSVDGAGSVARFNSPTGVAVDGAGNVYVADSSNNSTIRKITSDGVVTTLAGGAGVTGAVDGTGSAARFGDNIGLAADRLGNIYVVDTNFSTIRKVTSGGVVTTLAGKSGGLGWIDGIGSAARFNYPQGVTVDSAGNIYVADTSNEVIRKITSDGTVTSLAGLTYGSSDGIGSAARFFFPSGIVVDSAGYVYIADSSNNTIRRGALFLGPLITASPASRTVSLNSTAVYSVAVTQSSETVSYQWRKDGVAILGATGATLVIPAAVAANAGSYSCVISNASDTNITDAATLAISASADFVRIVNLSILTSLSNGEGLFTVGTVIGGAGTSGTKPLLVRAAGPTLGAAPFNIPGTLPDPRLEVFTGSASITSNDNWAGTTALTNAFTSVGAFPYVNATSKDAAYFNQALASGGYTIQVSDVAGATGTVIAELYDATPAASFTAATPRLINVSVLKQIPANGILTVGFVIGGSTAKTVLVRAVGPTLGEAPFNVGGVMADPQLTLFSGQTTIATNDNWGGDPQLTTAGNGVGAFAFNSATSKDAMLLVTLPPGAYTAQATGVAGSSGHTLVEVYEVP